MKDKAITGDMDGQPIVRRRTAHERFYDIISKLPSSSVNNSRKIVLSKLKTLERYPSVARAQEVEDMVDGISIDHGHYESKGGAHDISNPGSEPY